MLGGENATPKKSRDRSEREKMCEHPRFGNDGDSGEKAK